MKRKKLNNENLRALLILDSHTTRLQKELWKTLRELKVDVLTIPAHTSNETQPLDRVPNAQIKRLLQDVRTFPKKTKMKTDLKKFVTEICDSIAGALLPKNVKAGFEKAHVINEENNVNNLKEKIMKYLEELSPIILDSIPKLRFSKRFSISSKVLTSEAMLQEFEENERKKHSSSFEISETNEQSEEIDEEENEIYGFLDQSVFIKEVGEDYSDEEEENDLTLQKMNEKNKRKRKPSKMFEDWEYATENMDYSDLDSELSNKSINNRKNKKLGKKRKLLRDDDYVDISRDIEKLEGKNERI
jgi:hypothetical protein